MSRTHIAINDLPVIMPIDGGASVAAVIEILCSAHLADDHVLSGIVIDGLAWRTDEDELLADLPVGAIGSLSIYSQPPQDATTHGADDIDAAVEVIEGRLGMAARAFRLGQMGEALGHFIDAAELLKDSIYFLRLLIDHDRAPDDDPRRARLTALDGALSAALDAFNDAQLAGDWALVADLIEYEVSPHARALAGVLDHADQPHTH